MAPYSYRPMTGRQVSEAFTHLDITAKQFAKMAGFNYGRVRRALMGEEPLPHAATVILALLAQPGSMRVLEELTENYVVKNVVEKDV